MQTSHFTTVLDVRRARSDERVATKKCKLRISPQFWTSDEHEVTRGLRGDVQNLHFTTVLDVRRARSDERVVSRLGQPNPPCVKKRKNFKEVLIHSHSQQIFSANLLSRSSQHSHSQQIFSAISTAILSRSSQHSHSQQIFSAIMLLWSGVGGQLLSDHLLWSGVGGQLLSHHLLWSGVGGQLLSDQLLSYHLLWSGVGGQLLSHHLLWSGVGGQLLSDHLLWSGVGGQLLSHHLLWSGVGGQLLSDQLLSYHLLWSGVGGQLLSYHVGGQYCTSSLEGPFRGAFGNNQKVTLCMKFNAGECRRGDSCHYFHACSARLQNGRPCVQNARSEGSQRIHLTRVRRL